MTPAEKFIAEVRAAIAMVPVDDVTPRDVSDMADAFDCIQNALKAFDETPKDEAPSA